MEKERAVLVGLIWDDGRPDLDELAALAETAGAEVVERLVQKRDRPDPAYFIGQGKTAFVREKVKEVAADLVIFDEELTPVQERNLEEVFGVKTIDRTGLILDIFAQRARTKEARLQVELAQLTYLLPRLTGQGMVLSRLGGGIGTRGPGETKLELDRRRIRQRMAHLRHALAEVRAQRALMRRPREKAGVATVALVGYTNAGKSTLFNALTAGGALVEDKLFATLDPTLRRLFLPGGIKAVLVDTVGFIRKLPHQLVAAFRATLEEVVEADLLLHVLDVTAPDLSAQAAAVHAVLMELGIGDRPTIPVLNKIDLLTPDELPGYGRLFPGSVAVSARQGWGLSELKERVAAHFAARRQIYRFFVPFSALEILSRLHAEGSIKGEEPRADGVEVMAELDPALAERLKEYRSDRGVIPRP
ncbi:MAG: GTPase HflX [Firmicutes bacterium]|nr:GTPase HflX [Bacillota bacterium]